MDRKMTSGCRAGSAAARRRPSRHDGSFSKISIIAGFGCFLGVFAGFRNQDRIRTRSGRDQDAIRIGSGRDQGWIRMGSGTVLSAGCFRRTLLDEERHRGRNHLMFCTLRFLSGVFCPRVLDDPAPPRRAGRRRGGTREGGLCYLTITVLYIYYLMDALCEFSKLLLSHPCRGRLLARP